MVRLLGCATPEEAFFFRFLILWGGRMEGDHAIVEG